MNLIGAFMLLVLVCGAAIGIFAIAAGQRQTPFVDTYGNTTSPQSNQTQNLTLTTAPPIIQGLGGGLILVLAAFVLFLAAIIAWRPGPRQGPRGRR